MKPKYKIGDIIGFRDEDGTVFPFLITGIEGNKYTSFCGSSVFIEFQDQWELLQRNK